jgi:hypothetical protein
LFEDKPRTARLFLFRRMSMRFSFDPSQRPRWWNERDERVSHLAAILRAQGGLPPPKPGTFIPPELRAGYAAAGTETQAPESGADFAAFEAALPDDTLGRFQPIAQTPQAHTAAPIVMLIASKKANSISRRSRTIGSNRRICAATASSLRDQKRANARPHSSTVKRRNTVHKRLLQNDSTSRSA